MAYKNHKAAEEAGWMFGECPDGLGDRYWAERYVVNSIGGSVHREVSFDGPDALLEQVSAYDDDRALRGIAS